MQMYLHLMHELIFYVLFNVLSTLNCLKKMSYLVFHSQKSVFVNVEKLSTCCLSCACILYSFLAGAWPCCLSGKLLYNWQRKLDWDFSISLHRQQNLTILFKTCCLLLLSIQLVTGDWQQNISKLISPD